MRSCSAATENVYACLIDQVLTNSKHRVDQLTKIKTKLKDVVEEASEDCRKNRCPKSCSEKHSKHGKMEAGRPGLKMPILTKEPRRAKQ